MSSKDKKIKELNALGLLTTANAAQVFAAVTFNDVDYKLAMSIINPYIGKSLNVNSLYNKIQINYSSTTRIVTVIEHDGGATINYRINGIDYSIASPASLTLPADNGAYNYVLVLNSTGLTYIQTTYFAKIDSFDNLPLAVFTPETTKCLWSDNGHYVYLEAPKTVKLSRTLETAQNADLNTANNLIVSKSGNLTVLANNTNEIRLIKCKNEDGLNYQGGTFQFLDLKAGQKIKHLYAASGDYKSIRLASGQDFTASSDILILLIFDSTRDMWLSIGDPLAQIIADSTNILALPMQANGYQVATNGNITGWLIDELIGCRVEQLGSATVNIIDNSYINYTSGTLYGIKIYDLSDNLIHELACCENNINVPYLHCSVTGRVFYITNVKTVIKQDTYFKCKDNGWQRVTITETGDVMDVAYKNDKTRIYN